MSAPPTPSLDRTAGPDELARMSQTDRDAEVRRMLGKIKQAVADRGGEDDRMSGGSSNGGGQQSSRPGVRLLKIGGVDMTNGVDAELRPGTSERETGNRESGIEQLLGATGPPPAPPASLMHFGGVPGALGPDGMPAMPSSLWSNFYFQARHGTLEWRQIDRLDLDRVVRDVDVGALQDVLGTIAFAQMSVQNVRGQSDALVVKSFFVSQLCIEYLLNVQNMLFQTLELHRRAIEEGAKSRQATAGRLKRAQRDLSTMKKMLKQHKRAMSTYDGLLAMRRSGPQQQGRQPLALVHGSGHQREHKPKGVTVHCCRICDKRFRTYEHLKKHFDRRHPGNPVDDKALMDKQISRLAAAMEKAAESTMSATRERMRSVALSESYEQAEKERRVLLARVEKLTAEREKWQHVLGQLLPTQKKQSLHRVIARRTHEVLAKTWSKVSVFYVTADMLCVTCSQFDSLPLTSRCCRLRTAQAAAPGAPHEPHIDSRDENVPRRNESKTLAARAYSRAQGHPRCRISWPLAPGRLLSNAQGEHRCEQDGACSARDGLPLTATGPPAHCSHPFFSAASPSLAYSDTHARARSCTPSGRATSTWRRGRGTVS